MSVERAVVNIGGNELYIETGKMAKQADGSVIVGYGGTVVLGTVVASEKPKADVDFLPLWVDYREKTSAAGKIPGGYFKREGRPTEKEILTARLIDRPLRPLFPKGFQNEVQIMVMVLSADQENDPDILGMIAASAALSLSDIPFPETVGGVRIGRVNGEYVVFPTHEQLDNGDIDLVIAGMKDTAIMVEGGAGEVKEEDILTAIKLGLEEIGKVTSLIEELREKCGKEKREIGLIHIDDKVKSRLSEFAKGKVEEVLTISEKDMRESFMDNLVSLASEEMGIEDESGISDIKTAFKEIEKELVRKHTLSKHKRIDGRAPEEIRPVSCEVSILPRTHGSALFTRGETQSLAVATLGTTADEQMIEELKGKSSKNFMLHYNFPPFSVGEIKPIRGPGRREIGHGALAEKALRYVLPSNEEFPYTIRIVSDILESNGSSSMATVCGGCLALMDAGVPIKSTVGGIAMGMIKEGDEVVLLTDIMGLEDHFGDMDFKAAGTKTGITAIQMDLKIKGVSYSLIERILEASSNARIRIINEMEKVISVPRDKVSVYAPMIITVNVNPDKIGRVIGPSGKIIKGIIAKTGAEVNIDDDGKVSIASTDMAKAEEAMQMVKDIVAEAEVGKIYHGKVKRIMDFGAFVEILPGKEGLVHVSQLADHHVKKVEDVLKIGDEVDVKVISIDNQGRINLSRKAAVKQ